MVLKFLYCMQVMRGRGGEGREMDDKLCCIIYSPMFSWLGGYSQ